MLSLLPHLCTVTLSLKAFGLAICHPKTVPGIMWFDQNRWKVSPFILRKIHSHNLPLTTRQTVRRRVRQEMEWEGSTCFSQLKTLAEMDAKVTTKGSHPVGRGWWLGIRGVRKFHG